MAKRNLATTTGQAPAAEHIEQSIFVVRGQRVMLDSDLADLYGVATARLNEQVKRNADRFPTDFMFRLTRAEFDNLISQIATSSSHWGGRRKLPLVFTEHGVAMLSSVLRSATAARVNIEMMCAFRPASPTVGDARRTCAANREARRNCRIAR